MSSSLLQVKPKFCKSLLVAFYCPCLLIFTSCFQYEQLNGGSEEKLRALREIKETVQHRKHLDSSIDFIGRLIFGFENGPKMLETVRAYGEPLVDDWDCLKRMVSILIALIRLWHKARMKFPFLTQLRCLRTCIRFMPCWTYFISIAIARWGFSNPSAGRSLNTAWSTWGHLRTFATAVYPRQRWGSRASVLAAVTTWRGGALWLRDTAPDEVQPVAKVPEVYPA